MANNFADIATHITDLCVFSPGFKFYQLLICYLIGSIPFGVILTKLAGYGDIRKIGSGNIGATNVLRTGNKALAFSTLVLDASKALFAIILFKHTDPVILDQCYSMAGMISELLFLGFIVMVGHCFPIWLKFKGGKGVATALGILLFVIPYAGLAACATWLITAKITKISSLSALIAMAVAPIVTFFIYGEDPAFTCSFITLLVFWRHKDNIKRLLNGTEPKIGHKKKDADAPPVSE